jgi:hypothetical protein
MRSFILYLLLFATLLPIVSPWGIIAHYQLNRNYIARVLCENRDKPQLHCNGKCYLAKKLKSQQDKQDQETTERVQNTPVVQLFCQANSLFQFGPLWAGQPTAGFPAYNVPAYLAPAAVLFHPPQA